LEARHDALPAEPIFIVNLGSQVTQLIARRLREAGVYLEIAPSNVRTESRAS
jgi:GMP synthase-like glutamine amidotransferase